MLDNPFPRVSVTTSELPVSLDEAQPHHSQGLSGWPTEMAQLSPSSFSIQVAGNFSNPSVQGTNHGNSSDYDIDISWSSDTLFQNMHPDLSLVGAELLDQEEQDAGGTPGA